MVLAACLITILAQAETFDTPVAFESVRGKIVAPVSLNGGDTYRFLVDATVTRPVLAPAVARSLNLPMAGLAILPGLRVGRLNRVDVPVEIENLTGFRQALGMDIAGVLPVRLDNEMFLLDFGRRVLSFAPEGGRKYPFSTPLYLEPRGPEVAVTFGERVQRARIDLSFPGEVALPEALAQAWGLLDPQVPHLDLEPAPGAAGLRQVRLGSMRIGGASMDRALATVRPSDDLPLIGTGFLRHYAVLFDFAGERLHLAPLTSGPIEGAPVTGYGMLLDFFDGTHWSVIVAVNSPAYRAGVKSGDRLLSINGESLEGKGYAETAALLVAEAGATVKLLVQRGDETREVEVIAEVLF